VFAIPALVEPRGVGLKHAFEQSVRREEDLDIQALDAAAGIENFVQAAYGLTETDKQEVRNQFGLPVASLPENETNNISLLERLFLTGMSGAVVDVSKPTQQRQLPPDRHLRMEEICRVARVPPKTFVRIRRSEAWMRTDLLRDAVAASVQYCLGCAFGRWDIRFANGEKPLPELPAPFAPLPVCPPGQLQNNQGLPITNEEVARLKQEGRWNYPITIPWDGILVDDRNHVLDVEACVQKVMQVIWKDQWETIESEACAALNVRTLRDHFRKPPGFFDDHLKRYSKSRRQAPIYWPLSTESGSYTLWVYYQRLTEQTFYTCVNEFVDPKLREVNSEVTKLTDKGARSRDDEQKLETLYQLGLELQQFRDELLRLAKLPWHPNLNDGIQITAAPLWKLFRLPRWRKTLKETWEGLERGDYDWAYMAFTLWPDRIREKCKSDKSLAIAHGLEDLYVEPARVVRKKRGRKAHAQMVEEE